jgi:hypothetical protein
MARSVAMTERSSIELFVAISVELATAVERDFNSFPDLVAKAQAVMDSAPVVVRTNNSDQGE